MRQMSTLNRQFDPQPTSWWTGFDNLLRKESYEWWGTRRWIQQAVLWLVVCNGFAILLMFAMPALLSVGQESGGAPVIDPIDAGINLFLIASMTGISLGMALINVPSNANGKRSYGPKEIKRLKIIRTLRNVHYSMMSILRMLRQLDQGGKNLQEAIDTPGENEDIVSAADRYISALSAAEKDALEMIERSGEMLRCREG